MVKVKDTESFIRRAREIHGDRYDYSETVYSGSQEPITIICRACGPFTLRIAQGHVSDRKCGCRNCNKHNPRPGAGKRLPASFEELSRKAHGNRYEYEQSVYVGATCKIKVRCRKHGVFEVNAAIRHYGKERKQCPQCEIISKRLHTELCRKASRQRKSEKECEWTKWADRKVCILFNRLLKNKNAETQLPISFDSWDQWADVRKKSSLRSSESRWQKKCKNWQRGLVTRLRQGQNYST